MNRFVTPIDRAARHPIVCDKPAPDFFEGALLGNGGLGAVVTTRPDGIVLHFGHNNVWDIRISERNKDKIGTFDEVFERIKRIPRDYETLYEDDWYRDYIEMAREDYTKWSFPRPMPCGSLLLAFDRRKVEVLGHRLELTDGVCTVEFLIGQRRAFLKVFVEPERDIVWMKMEDEEGGGTSLPFDRIRLLPDPETPDDIPAYEPLMSEGDGVLSFRQSLPCSQPPQSSNTGESSGQNPIHPNDKAFRTTVRVNGKLCPKDKAVTVKFDNDQTVQRMNRYHPLEAKLNPGAGFVACVVLEQGLASAVPIGAAVVPDPSAEAWDAALELSRGEWRSYWERSGVELDDPLLESVWYRNLYFLNCAVKPGMVCPGLFANWSYRRIGSNWHGDYHLNYNTQQPFWAVFSSNHVEKHLPYVDLVDHLMPISRQWASEYYGLRGAYFPHSAYPVHMEMMPWPAPEWGWEICETPWTVQSLWWHYLYTMDRQFLERRAFVPIKEAVRFLADYMKRPEAHGDAWGDDKYHVFPTVAPELYELTPGFGYNADCITDLALIKFVFKAFLEACSILGREQEEAELTAEVRGILGKFPEYPQADAEIGRVFVSVPGEHPATIYNVPNPIVPVFPGEDIGLHSAEEEYATAVRSYLQQRNEGSNELVFLNLAAARLGILNLERFKRELRYCEMPNGTFKDMVFMSGGRYHDQWDFHYMGRMGVWFENVALPAVINECLMQSYNGVIRLFPNWPTQRKAKFSTLRAVGGFLVSSIFEQGEVKEAEIISEAGSMLAFYIPWTEGARIIRGNGEELLFTGPEGQVETVPGETVRIVKLSNRQS